MANPQLEDGYTRFANDLLEALVQLRIPGQEMRVVLAVGRLTYGWGKKSDQISYGQLASMTDIPRPRVIEHVKSLVSKMILGSHNNGTRRPLTLWINKDFETWQPSPKKETSPNHVTTPSPKDETRTSPNHETKPSPNNGTHQRKGKKGKKNIKKGGEEVATPSPENNSAHELASISSGALLNCFNNPTVQSLVEKSLDLIASTRRTGRVAESVRHRFVRQLLQFEEWKIGTAITKYIEGEYWLDNKGERYLLGILRNVSARDYREVVGKLQQKGQCEREPPAQDIQPTTWAQAESAERRTMAQWLLEQNEEGEDAEQKDFEARTDQALDSISGCEARSG